MADGSRRWGTRGIGGAHDRRNSAETDADAAAKDPRVSWLWSRGLWFSRRRLDLCSYHSGYPNGIRSVLPQGPCFAFAERTGLDPANPGYASDPTGRRSDRTLASRGVAGVAAESGA